ncbi:MULTISPECIES: hypothetical protein [Lactiplantibacillus]|uniref:Uncharacterized protein n=1 Tax=Lactiplantibacillus argentoratensis TaxID=271881 RepID=A0ABS5UGK3_9LACO|nr:MULTISPECIES: hypothetical protein [Lactiplantibacillus]MBT1137707.1 hypothetical protein [Lactiplantibacillus argentoratensis]MBT1140565.1 hypothetical protein [Lactiplantibacillus argentoratensis]MDN7062823.1 hypothetical protein [Lactiplantibacillus plantarum]
MVEKKKIKATMKQPVAKFMKNDLLAASGFSKLDIDILKVTLSDKEQYSLEQAKNEIKKFKEAI